MKKIILPVAFLWIGATAYAQKITDADVPVAVKTAFSTKHPGTHVKKWEKESPNYEAEFDMNKVENSELYSASGALVETEMEIAVSALPAGVSTYVKNNLGGKKIKEASKITSATGTVTYEAEVGGDDYIFDSNGNFLNKEVETDNDKD